jgi:hypothetical protein
MNIEIILRDSEGRQTERLSMDHEPSDLYLSLTHDDCTLARGFIDPGSRYTPPGPQPNKFGIKLEARADNLTREVGAPVISRDSRRDLDCIPSTLIEGLTRYAEHGTPVGDFLQAVIANDFRDAACRADDGSFRALTALAIYVYQEMPSKCHGSREKYRAWLATHEAGSLEREGGRR